MISTLTGFFVSMASLTGMADKKNIIGYILSMLAPQLHIVLYYKTVDFYYFKCLMYPMSWEKKDIMFYRCSDNTKYPDEICNQFDGGVLLPH